jgi:SAM-dependent methyltransferase
MQSLYDFPQVYEAVLARPQRVIEEETQSILGLLDKHHIHEGNIIELACGTCPHGIALVERGFKVVGIDRSIAMLQDARSRAEQESVEISLVHGDIVDFGLEEAGFSTAIFMYETFPLIADLDDIICHFKSVRRHLREGGIYVVDVDVPKQGIRQEGGEWGRRNIGIPDGHLETWYEDFPGDWMQGTKHVVLHCRIHLEDEVYETRDELIFRSYSLWDWRLLVRALDSWQLDGFYSWQNLSQEISDEDHYFVVLIAC